MPRAEVVRDPKRALSPSHLEEPLSCERAPHLAALRSDFSEGPVRQVVVSSLQVTPLQPQTLQLFFLQGGCITLTCVLLPDQVVPFHVHMRKVSPLRYTLDGYRHVVVMS
jgi:hypothetical protein